ncbi:hypothetical protein [Faecalispora anaeroviscerum]|uniref:hypothetical protein n=1 Tax=Faecalispora anaeroviscerum TaxID=2991836 RepID=UPI0024BB33C8|nr:hypothetical protein [Faecalispora anaeroviscerum]
MGKIPFKERFLRFYHKTIPFPIFLLTVILFLCLVLGMMNKIEQIAPSGTIEGLYQSRFFSSTYYNARFFHDEFQIERLEREEKSGNKEKVLLKGTYEHVEENLYLLKADDPAQNTIVVLGKNSFYFYDEETDTTVRFFRH